MKTLHNVLIAEDEDIIRNGLAYSIPWEEKGLCAITAKNGKEALAIFQSKKIDLIITDIKMPFVSGIELIESVRKTSSDVPIIILSGYDDFKYAQQAIRLGACEYLLKPLIMEDFLPLLDKLILEINKKKHPSSSNNSISDEHRKILDALKTKNNYDCLQPYLSDKKYFSFCLVRLNQLRNLILDNDYLNLFEIDNDFYNNFSTYIQSQNILCITLQFGERLLLLTGDSKNSVSDTAQGLADICRVVKNKTNCHVLLTEPRSSISEIEFAYAELLELQTSHYINDANFLTTYDSFISNEASITSSTYYSVNASELEEVVLGNNVDEIINWFETIQADVTSKKEFNSLQSLMIAGSIYHKLMNIFDKKCDIASQSFLSPQTSYSKLLKQNSFEEMILILSATALDISNIIAYEAKPNYSDTFQVALDHIDTHYCDQGFSLESVAKYANMGRCYLSAMFTQNIGKTFIEYLTELRMKRAIELMQQPSKMVYEIAEETGYQNSTYFSTVFKKYYGMSPKEYKMK